MKASPHPSIDHRLARESTCTLVFAVGAVWCSLPRPPLRAPTHTSCGAATTVAPFVPMQMAQSLDNTVSLAHCRKPFPGPTIFVGGMRGPLRRATATSAAYNKPKRVGLVSFRYY